LNALEVINKDLVLRTIGVSILCGVDGRTLGVRWVEHVHAFSVSPIHRLEWFLTCSSLVSPVGIQIARGLTVTSNRRYGFANNTLGGVSNVALERCHVHLISTADGIVNPEPRAVALAIRASWEVRNIERLKRAGRTILRHRKDDEVFWVNIPHIRLVGNTKSTSRDVRTLWGMEVGGPFRTSIRPWVRGNEKSCLGYAINHVP